MERKYKQLFDLTVKHTYYTSGYANDFVFSPTMQTAKDLSRYKLIARLKHAVVGHPEAYGLKTSYCEVDGAPLIPITATDNPSLVFGLNLKNTRFLNVTTEIPVLATREVFHFTNVGVTLAPTMSLVRTSLRLRRKVFEFNFSLTGTNKASATIEILNAANAVQAEYTQILENVDGNYQALIDLNGLDDGIFSVRVLKTVGLTTVSTTKYYISDELTAMNPMAILDLKLTNNTDLLTRKLEINFTRRSINWKYWVVYLNPVAGAITVTKAGVPFSEDVVPLATTMDTATKLSLETQYPLPAVVRLFVSDNPVPLIEEPIKDIKLKRAATTLVKHLPGMPIDSPKTEAYIFI